MRFDPIRIRQMLDNLLENVLRYTDAPGKVAVELDDRGVSARLVVQDSAPKPAVADLAKLFDRFFRDDPSRTRQRGGAGLGLTICRGIAEAHGGTIAAAESPLGGLRIVVDLPKYAGNGA